MVSLVCGRDRTGFPRFSQAGRYQKHYQPAEPRRVTAIIFIEYYSVVIGEFQSFTQFYHNRPFYHTPTKKASVILRPLAARTALYLYYTRTSGKGKRFLPVFYSIPQPTLYTISEQMASTFDPRKRHAGSPLPFFQYVSIIQVSGKMASIILFKILLAFSMDSCIISL